MKREGIAYGPVIGYTALLIAASGALGWVVTGSWYPLAILLVPVIGIAAYRLIGLYSDSIRRVTFMFNAIDNDDFTFRFHEDPSKVDNGMLNAALNRIKEILVRAKVRAEERERYYQLIMEYARTGLITINDAGSVYQANGEALRIFGLPRITHIQQLELPAPEAYRVLTKIRPGEKHHVSCVTETGEMSLSLGCSEIVLEKRRLRVVVISDINSELSEMQIESWSKLTRILTHEIMNSIAPVISLSETVAERATINGMNEKDYAIMVQAMQTIHRRSKGLLDFVENYRKLTRLPLPTLRNFSVSALFDDIRLLFPEKSDILFFHVKPEDLNLYADRIMVEQVLINLLKNAIEACEESLSPQIVVEAVQKAGMVIISVIDNGSGIVPEAIDKVFVPFFTTKSKGSGIGLSLCRQIMNRHRGSISLDSQVEKGSSFVLRFPIVTKRIL